MNLELFWLGGRHNRPLSIPKRDLMNLERGEFYPKAIVRELSIPKRDLMNLEPPETNPESL